MHKYVYEILQELSIQRPSSRKNSSRCFSTAKEKKDVKSSLSPQDKQFKSYVIAKLNKFQAEKQILLARKQKALLWYKIALEKLLDPLIEYMPNVTSLQHLSKLSDFRTNEGYSEHSEETNKKIIIVRPKCVEEPIPILIKPEYKVSKCRKKDWTIINKLVKARESKNEIIHKYKIWKNKVVKKSKDQKKADKTAGLMVYELFLKDTIESKIEDLMPSIKEKDKLTHLYDFRLQNSQQFEQCENDITIDTEVISSSIKRINKKGIKPFKTVMIKPIAKTNSADPIPVKNTKQNNKSLLIKHDKNNQVIKVKNPAVHSKEENQGKQLVQRTLHKQNWGKSESQIKLVNSETVKEKLVKSKINAPLKIKKPELIHPSSNITLPIVDKNNTASINENVEMSFVEKDIQTNKTAEAGNISEIVLSKSNGINVPVHEDEKVKFSANTSYEIGTSDINVNEISDVNFKIKSKENCISDLEENCVVGKIKSNEDVFLGKSIALSRTKPNNIDDEVHVTEDIINLQDNIRFPQERDVNRNDNQHENKNNMLTIATSNMNKSPHECDLIGDPIAGDCLAVENEADKENSATSNRNVLQNTFLVSFEVKDDEAFLKTRSQVVADEIKGDFVDLDIVLQEEKKARDVRKHQSLSENKKCSSNNTNLLVNASRNEPQYQNKAIISSHLDKNLDDKKINVSPITQDVSTEPSTMNPSKRKNDRSKSIKSNLTDYANKNTQYLKKNNTLDDNLNKSNSSELIMKTKTLKPSNVISNNEQNNPTNSEVIISGIITEHEKPPNKTHSLELIGQDKKEKTPRHKKLFITKKDKNKMNKHSLPDKRISVMNESKELDSDKNYQDIINSVKKIIPSSESNESIIRLNSQKLVLTGSKANYTEGILKKYNKTIDELKEIINELPDINNQAAIAPKQTHVRGKENKRKEANETIIYTTEHKNIVPKDILDGKQTDNKVNKKNKLINLKTIKVVDRITNEEGELKPLSTNLLEKHSEAISLKVGVVSEKPRKTKSTSNVNLTFNDKILEQSKEFKSKNTVHKNNKSDEDTNLTSTALPRTPLKIKYNYVENNTSNTNILKDQSSVKSKGTKVDKSEKIEDFKTSEKRRSSGQVNIKNKEVRNKTTNSLELFGKEGNGENGNLLKANSDLDRSKVNAPSNKNHGEINITPETNKSKRIEKNLPVIKSEKELKETTGKGTRPTGFGKDTSIDTTGNILKENGTLVSVGLGNNINSKENEKMKLHLDKFVKNISKPKVNQKRIIKFTRLSETVLNKITKTKKNLIKSEKNEVLSVNTVKEKQSKSAETTQKQNFSQQKPASLNMNQDKNKNLDQQLKKGIKPTGVLATKLQKVKVIPNEKSITNTQLSKSTVSGNTFSKNHIKRKLKVNRVDIMDQEHVSQRLESG